MREERFQLPAFGPEGKRLAIIGDVHGEFARFKEALDSIKDPKDVTLIILGDLIDRGPDSKGCLALARDAETRFGETILLPGNHEQMLWFGYQDPEGPWADVFSRNGGAQTFMEFGYNENAMLAAVPTQILRRLQGELPVWHREGDLFFIHAGLNPGMDPDAFVKNLGSFDQPPAYLQEQASPLWVREGFYASRGHEGPYRAPEGGDPVLVVYGHTRIGYNAQDTIMACVREDLASWRMPMDMTGSGQLTVLEVVGNEAVLRFIGDEFRR